MFNTKQEIIINKTVSVNSKEIKFISLLFCTNCTAIIYCCRDDGQLPMIRSRTVDVIELSAGGAVLTFDDTVKHTSESCLYEKLLAHYGKITNSADCEDLIFYISFSKANLRAKSFNKIQIKLLVDNREMYIGREFYLKEGETYSFESDGVSVKFFIKKIIKTDNNRIILYRVNGADKLNFYLKDYLAGCNYKNEILCSMISKDEICGAKACSCELPENISDDGLYVLFSIERQSEKSVQAVELPTEV